MDEKDLLITEAFDRLMELIDISNLSTAAENWLQVQLEYGINRLTAEDGTLPMPTELAEWVHGRWITRLQEDK